MGNRKGWIQIVIRSPIGEITVEPEWVINEIENNIVVESNETLFVKNKLGESVWSIDKTELMRAKSIIRNDKLNKLL